MTEIDKDLFDAIMIKESGGKVGNPGKEDAEGDLIDGVPHAIGPYQIWKRYYDDAVEKDPTLKANGMKYENCKGRGSKEYSKKVVQAYMNRYATEARLGRKVTSEDIARIHNGGPNGYDKKSTKAYWDAVEVILQEVKEFNKKNKKE